MTTHKRNNALRKVRQVLGIIEGIVLEILNDLRIELNKCQTKY